MMDKPRRPNIKHRDYVWGELSDMTEHLFDVAEHCELDPLFIVWLMTERIVLGAVDRYNYDPKEVITTIKMAMEREEMEQIEPKVFH